MDGAAIEVEGLRKVYPPTPRLGDVLRALSRRAPDARRGKLALDGVSFSLPAGTTLGVVGRNGSGKTTLLRILSGVLVPTAGRVAVRGRIAGLLDLGSGIDPEFTGRENALLLGVLAGTGRREMARRLDTVRDFSGLEAAFDEPVRSYSAGMTLRLAFSTAVHVEPEVLLVDEVLAVGDAFFQQRCLRRVRELQRGGCSVVLVTHDPSAVIGFCDRALWLEHGRILCAGEPAKVVREYLGARYRDGVALGASPLVADAAAEVDGRDDLEPALELPNVDQRFGDGGARIEGIAIRDRAGRPLAAPVSGGDLRVVITARCHERLASPIVGFVLRDRLGGVVSATNTSYEGSALPPLAPGDRVTVELAMRWPPFASGAFSLSPAIADGTLDQHRMNDWIDNALVVEVASPEVRYGWLRLEGVSVRCALERGDGS